MAYTNTNKIAIENVQRYLRQLSLYDKTIPPIAIDGIYDEQTRAAIRAFQRLMSLEETGTVDYGTWTVLFDAYVQSMLQYSDTDNCSPFPRFPEGYSVGTGNNQFLVEIIQFMLNELTVWMDAIPRNAQGGVFDEDTENGILIFQRTNLLPETGRVDRRTWNALVGAYAKMLEENA